jgi:hypothetical protein
MQKSLLVWFFLLGLCAVTASRASAQASQEGEIKFARVTGDVSYKAKGSAVATKAENNKSITQGNTVTTGKGGSVVLVFSNGATINLKEDSVIDIEQYLQDPFAADFNPATATDEPTVSNTKLNLTRGELVGNVKHLKKDKGSSFSVQTPVGAAGIRGTTFRIVYRPSGNGTAFFSLTTSEGSVELATGTVTLPVGPSSESDSPKEVVIEVQVNDTTGVVTMTTPAGQVVVVDAPPTSVAAVTKAVAEVAQAVAAVVFAPAPASTNPAPTETKTSGEKAADNANGSSGAVQPLPQTTSGAGGTE